MTLVRVVWTETGAGVFKRSGVSGPAPSTATTLLTKAGVKLKDGKYVVNWSFAGEVGATVALVVQKETAQGWTPVSATGPHAIKSGSARVGSLQNKPDGYVEMTFTL